MRKEVFRAARICAPCLDRLGGLTFCGPVSAVDSWADSVFARHLLSAAILTHQSAAIGGLRELIASDLDLNDRLAGPIATRSRAAGRLLALEFKAPSGARILDRFSAAVSCGEAAGHFASIFAARAAVFHFPPSVMISALLFLELRPLPTADVWLAVAGVLSRLSNTPGLLRAA